jgi:hypothetical protein
MNIKLYYIQDTRSYRGNSCFWWGPNRNGHVVDIKKAGKYTQEELVTLGLRDKAWECTYIDSLVQSHVDIQDLRKD